MKLRGFVLTLALVTSGCGGSGDHAGADQDGDGTGADAPALDAWPSDGADGGTGPLSYGERCGNAIDDDGDGLVDEDCTPSLFAGVYAPAVATDGALPAIESASGRSLAVLQTYHSMSAVGVERTGPDLAAIFARGQVAHLNVEPDGYTRAQLGAPAADPVAHDSAAMGSAIATALAAAPGGRILLTFGAEMNGMWTSWGCLPADQYIALYRSAHDAIVAALDAAGIDRRRVRWAFGPDARGSASCASASAYYPGHVYTDLLGLSAYRAGTESVATAVTAPMTALLDGAGIASAWRPGHFVVLQTGSRAPDRGAWVRDLYATLAADARVAGVIYFDASTDWSIPTAGTGWTEWTSALHDTPVADASLAATFTPWFWDVPYAHPAFGEIQALRDANVTTGCGEAPPRFCPDEIVNRRGAALLLARAFALPAGSSTPAFHDVPATDPAFAAVQALAASGATTGCGAGAFCPDQLITELQLATLVTALGGADDPGTIATASPATRARAAVFVAHGARLAPAPL